MQCLSFLQTEAAPLYCPTCGSPMPGQYMASPFMAAFMPAPMMSAAMPARMMAPQMMAPPMMAPPMPPPMFSAMTFTPPAFMTVFQPVFNAFNKNSVAMLASQMPSYIFRIDVHDGELYCYSNKPLYKFDMDKLSGILKNNGASHCWMVYDADMSMHKPITVDTNSLPECNGLCPVKEANIAKPNAAPSPTDISVTPPASMPQATIPMPQLVSLFFVCTMCRNNV